MVNVDIIDINGHTLQVNSNSGKLSIADVEITRMTIPNDNGGTNGQFLQTDGSGLLSWADAGGALTYGPSVSNQSTSDNEHHSWIGTNSRQVGSRSVTLGWASGGGNDSACYGKYAGYGGGNSICAVGTSCLGHGAGNNATAMGQAAGGHVAGTGSVNIGYWAGQNVCQPYAVNIGYYSGRKSAGDYSINIGANTNKDVACKDNSITINSTGQVTTCSSTNKAICITADPELLTTSNEGLYIAPIREATNSKVLYYDTTSKEITYSDTAGALTYGPSVSNQSTSDNEHHSWIGKNSRQVGSRSVTLGWASGGGNDSACYGKYAGYGGGNSICAVGTSCLGHGAGNNAVAMGQAAGGHVAGTGSVNIGHWAGQNVCQPYAVNIGYYSGRKSAGDYSINIGANTNKDVACKDNSITINSTGQITTCSSTNKAICITADPELLTTSNEGLYIAPIREATNSKVLYYDTTSKEITYSDTAGALTYGPSVSNQSTSDNEHHSWIGTNSRQVGSRSVTLGWASGGGNDSACYGKYAGYGGGHSIVGVGANCLGHGAGNNATAMGQAAGGHVAGTGSVNIGYWAGQNTCQPYAVNIGYYSGRKSAGDYSINIGANTNKDVACKDNSITINSTGQVTTCSSTNKAICITADPELLTTSNEGLYIAPIREATNSKVLYYDTTSKEITYAPHAASGGGDGIGMPVSTTIGDFSQPTSATASSAAGGADWEWDGSATGWTFTAGGGTAQESSSKIELGANSSYDSPVATYDLYTAMGSANLAGTWVLRFKVEFSNFQNTASGQALKWECGMSHTASISGENPTSVQSFQLNRAQHAAGGNGNYYAYSYSGGGSQYTAGGLTSQPYTATRYVQLTRLNTTQAKVQIYTDSNFSSLDQEMTVTQSSTVANLRYLFLRIYQQGVSNSNTVYASEFQVWNNTTSGGGQSASLSVDNDTSTHWQSNSQANPNIYVDLGSAKNCGNMALWWNSASTETQVKLQSSANASAWTDLRTINVSDLTAGQYNYIRFNIQTARYFRVYGNSGSTVVMAINEIKHREFTDGEVATGHSHIDISSSDTSLALDGT